MPVDILLPIIILIISLVFSAFFSSSEISYTSVNRLRLQKQAEKGDKKAARALKITDQFDQNIATILFGNGLVNIASSSMGTLLALKLLSNVVSDQQAALISSAIIFVIIVVIGEIIPKTLARRFSLSWSVAFAPIVSVFRYLFFPVVFIINLLMRLIAPLWQKKQPATRYLEDELVEIVDTIEKEGFIDQKQGDLIRSAIEFADIDAFEVMTPRVDVQAYNIEDDLSELLNDPKTFTYSRIPVYDDTIDKIIGILPTKYLYQYMINKQQIDIRPLLQKPVFVPRGNTISSILKMFKKSGQHMAIVVDEYGGTEGIITLEDIVEEIVGEIWDETDEVEEPFIRKSKNIYLIDGNMNIDDFFELMGIEEEIESDYTTVGGWCQEMLGRFGKINDRFQFHNLKITVLQADEFTIEKIRVFIAKQSSTKTKLK
jgi:putative hemolysin